MCVQYNNNKKCKIEREKKKGNKIEKRNQQAKFLLFKSIITKNKVNYHFQNND